MRRIALVGLAMVALPVLTGFGCEKKHLGYQSHSYATRTMKSSVEDVHLPISLWAKIEGVFSEKVPDTVPTEFMAIKVFLIEKNRGILGGSNYELLFNEGGGEIDLKEFLADRNGTFYFAVEPVVEGAETAPKVFYLSNAKKRTLGKQAIGAGCDSYYDISTFFGTAMKGDGVMVNTTAGRHASALSGTYFFAIPHAGKLHLAQLTIKDSRFRQLQCRRL